jgi:predicted amidohydrolase
MRFRVYALFGVASAFTIAVALAFAPAEVRRPAPAVASDRPATVKVAAIQCSSDLGAVEANRQKLTALVEEAAAAGAKIIVLPETAVTGYLSQDLQTNWRKPGRPMNPAFPRSVDPITAAEAVPGPSTTHFAALAERLGVYITVPLLECVSNLRARGAPAYFNTVCLVSPKGELVAHYRKLTPWPHPEQSWASPGDRGVQTYDTEYGRVGLAICFDIHTILPKYQPAKLWALLYPIAWVDDAHPAEWFWHTLPAHVAKFDHYVIGANWSVDEPQPWFGYGFSTIISPEGKVLASAKSLHGSEIVYAEIETAAAPQPEEQPSTPRN